MEGLGKTLLEDVRGVSMDELLQLLHAIEGDFSASTFNFKPLDEIVTDIKKHKSQHYERNLAAQQHRSDSHSLLELRDLQQRQAIHSSVIVEVTSGSPGAGKTHLLYLLISRLLLPVVTENIASHGAEPIVVVLDLDARFDSRTLATTLRSCLESRLSEQSNVDSMISPPVDAEREIENIMIRSLQNVHIFQPQSLASFQATLEKLQHYLFDDAAQRVSNCPLAVLVIDGMSAFYWQHRAAEDARDMERLEGAAHVESKDTEKTSYLGILGNVKRLAKLFQCPVIFSSQGSMTRQHKTRDTSDRDGVGRRVLLPPAWQTIADIQIHVERVKTIPFAPGMTVTEAWAERKLRQDVVDRSLFVANVVKPVAMQSFSFTIKNGVVGHVRETGIGLTDEPEENENIGQ